MADRLLTINLRNYLVRQPVRKRHVRLPRYVRNRVAHYVKVEEEKVKISKELNSLMMKSYSRSMLPLKLNVRIENGTAMAEPFAQKKEAPQPKQQAGARPGEPKAAAAVQKTGKKAKPKMEAGNTAVQAKEAKPATASAKK